MLGSLGIRVEETMRPNVAGGLSKRLAVLKSSHDACDEMMPRREASSAASARLEILSLR